MKSLRMYICGGVGTGIAIIVWSLVSCGGLAKCIDGIRLMIPYCTNVYGPKAIGVYIKEAYSYMHPELSYLIVILLGTLSAAKVYGVKKNKVPRFRYLMIMGLTFWFLVMTIQNASDAGFQFYTKFGMISMFASITAFSIARKDYDDLIFFVSLSLPHIVFCVTNGILAGDGIVGRMYTMIPCLGSFIFIMIRELQLVRGTNKQSYVVEFIAVVVSAVLLRFDFCYVYRDSAIPELTATIDSGIYKGLHTTERNAESLLLLQGIVSEYSSEKEKIVIMDCTPSVYLMTDAVSLGPITWDITRFNNGRDDSEKMLGFFDYMGDIPDKIFYVANPYKPKLSIDEPTFMFNNFVNENYHLIEQKDIGDLYNIRVYAIN